MGGPLIMGELMCFQCLAKFNPKVSGYSSRYLDLCGSCLAALDSKPARVVAEIVAKALESKDHNNA